MINGNSPPPVLGAINVNNQNSAWSDRKLELFFAAEKSEISSPQSSHYSSCGERSYHYDDSDCENRVVGYVSANSFGTPTICSSFRSSSDYFHDPEVGSLRSLSFHEEPILHQFEPGYETEGSQLRSSRKILRKRLQGRRNLGENNIRVWWDKSNARVGRDEKEDSGALSERENMLASRDGSASQRESRGSLSSISKPHVSASNSANSEEFENFEVRTNECVEDGQQISLDCSFEGDNGHGLNMMVGDWEGSGVANEKGFSLSRQTEGFASDHEGEANEMPELHQDSNRFSDFDNQSEFDSMLGDATDEEDEVFNLSQRNKSFRPGNGANQSGSENPLLLNSEVVFGANDWDEFIQEVGENDLRVAEPVRDVLEVHFDEESRSFYSKDVEVGGQIDGASKSKAENLDSSLKGIADKLVFEDMLATPVSLGSGCTSSGSGRPDLEEDDKEDLVRTSDCIQPVNKLKDSDNLVSNTNNDVGDSGLSIKSPKSPVDYYLAEEEERKLGLEKPHIQVFSPDGDMDIPTLQTSLDRNHEKELECAHDKDEIEEEKNCLDFDELSARQASSEQGTPSLFLSDTKTLHMPTRATSEGKYMEKNPRIEVNGASFIPLSSKSGDIYLSDMDLSIEAKDIRGRRREDLGPDELSRYVEALDVNESYIDTVHDMEDVLLDSGESVGGMFVHTNRGLPKVSSRGYKDEALGASTSGVNTTSQSLQYPLKLDGIEVVGAKQRKGGASFGERLVGVKEYTVYQIRVQSGKNQWEIERRYSDFLGLYHQLKKALAAQGGLNLPYPWELVERESRKIFGNASPDVISERSELVQECLLSLLRAGSPFSSAPPLFWFLLPQRNPFDTTAVIKGSASENSKRALDEKGSSLQSLQGLSRDSHNALVADDCKHGHNKKASAFGKTIRLIIQIHPHKSVKQLLEEQHYSCAGCYKHLNIEKGLMQEFVQTLGWGKPRFCEYTGQLFCTSCHSNETAVLPARVLQRWDFTSYPVSQLAKAYLDSIYDQPMLCVSAVNPFIFSKVLVLVHVMEMRKKLSRILACIRCPSRTSIQRSLRARRYLLENSDFFALRDLVDLSKGAFAALPCLMEALLKKVYVHITQQCSVCREVGELCGAQLNCEKPSSLIFPFQEGEVLRCNSCGLIFHRSCFKKLSGCPCSFTDNIDDTNGKSPLCDELELESSVQSGSSSILKSSSNLSINRQESSRGFLTDLFQKAIPDNILKPKKRSGVLNMASLSSSLGL
uniref:PX domain-containing protein n=1 Tax=Araucaria cunninghamii TaxID=56994 RepID=A0A0D6QVH4_ARACU